MNKLVKLFVMILLIGGCAANEPREPTKANPSVDEIMQSWVGSPEIDSYKLGEYLIVLIQREELSLLLMKLTLKEMFTNLQLEEREDLLALFI